MTNCCCGTWSRRAGRCPSFCFSSGRGLVSPEADGIPAAFATLAKPFAVVLDCMLPALDGAAVARTLRAWYGASLPIIRMSASGRVREAARTLGILAYLEKPFAVAALVTLVQRCLGLGSPAGTAIWQAAERLLAVLQEQGGAPRGLRNI